MTSAIYGVLNKGQLSEEVDRLNRMAAHAQSCVDVAVRDGQSATATTWSAISAAATAEFAAAQAAYASRFPT